MVSYLRARAPRANVSTLIILAACGLVASYATVALAGTKTGLVLALVTTIGPLLLYVALVEPVIFPLGLYAILVPLNNILNLTSSGTITRVLGAAATIAMLFYMIRSKRVVEPPRATALWILFFLWMTATLFWAIDLQSAEQLLPTSLQLFAMYVVMAMFPLDLKRLRQLTIATAFGGTVAAAYGLYLYHTGAGIFDGRLVIQGENAQLNPDHFAASLILPLAICMVALLWTRSLGMRILAFMSCGVMLATIGLSASRGAWLGVAVVFIYLLLRDPHRRPLAAYGAALCAIAIAVIGPASFISRWALAGQNGGAGRVSIWRVGWFAFKENWLFGAGYANFPFAYDRAFMQAFQSFYTNWHRASHNILLNAGVELGIIGLALLLLGWWGQYRLLGHIGKQDPRFPMSLAMQSALIALFICGMFIDLMIEKYVWFAFILVVLTRNAQVPATVTAAMEPVKNA